MRPAVIAHIWQVSSEYSKIAQLRGIIKAPFKKHFHNVQQLSAVTKIQGNQKIFFEKNLRLAI